MRRGATIAAGAAAIVALAAPAVAPASKRGKDAKSSLDRPRAPLVLEGSDLPAGLAGVEPERLVAFKYRAPKRGRRGRWRQVPVQVDERLAVDFGDVPTPGPVSRTPGTVYGTAAGGVTALQYADRSTFVGPDDDPSLDADDEIVVMAKDAGDRAPSGRRTPRRARKKGLARIKVEDPVDGGRGWVYLFAATRDADHPLDPAAGRDYVDYEFSLQRGSYQSTYDTRDGPNPESSRVIAKSYVAGFSDRWIFDLLRIGGASAPDILDGHKFGIAPGQCGRSEDTFSGTDTNDRPNDRGEGAFVANIDGPVRAIRSYVGANSGPYTQRTHLFYATEHSLETNLRVHAIPGLFSHYDLSSEAIGMTYRSSAHPGGVRVDGVPDAVGEQVPSWHLWSGSQGSLFAADRVASSFDSELTASQRGYYLDDATPADRQCWGDSATYGAAGIASAPPGGIPDTDPRSSEFETLRSTSTTLMGAPGAGAVDAERWSDRLDSPLGVSVRERR